ncbi:macrolide-specific efflux system membrane fusion protein [Nitrospirillum amazonense]|uniref:Macrolide-specific efflux system membrane fusion protein n=1 Tax=Nitrospirillum amazonense TaxID=28077 RepID=A0A560FKC6_9PROT|nr:efflux RND transporter periplasmic adaptor subunit [Nitrospirillum amazonense]TWB22055.1 macrolide-specific efflux system membrane fusion protein [Nitrospirillum amazonense]
MKKLTYIGIIAGVVVAGVLIKFVVWPSHAAPQYVTVPVKRGAVEQTVLASGVLFPKKLVSVGAQVSGQVKLLNVTLGQQVTQGQLIAEIDSAPQVNALKAAEAALENVQAELGGRQATLEQAKLNFEREAAMAARNANSRLDYETARAAYDNARADVAALNAQISQAKIAVDLANVNLRYTKISAPIDGTVVSVVTEQGQTVNANQTAPTIILLADLKTMTVKAKISEADIVKVKPGQDLYFKILASNEHRYYSTLRFIDPAPEDIESSMDTSSSSRGSGGTAATANPVYYNGRFDVENPDGQLRPNMTAEVFIVLAKAENALVVPSAALGPGTAGGDRTVRVLGAEGVSTRTVRVGIDNNEQAEILSGLEASEKVIVGEMTPGDGPQKPTRR